MSFIKLSKNLFETSTIVLRKNRTYVSGSTGVTRGGLTVSANTQPRVHVNPRTGLAGATTYSDAPITRVHGTDSGYSIDATNAYLESIRSAPSKPQDLHVKYITASFFDYTTNHRSFLQGNQSQNSLGRPIGNGILYSYPNFNSYYETGLAQQHNTRYNVNTAIANASDFREVGVTNPSDDDLSYRFSEFNNNDNNIRLIDFSFKPGSLNDLGTTDLLAKSCLKKQIVETLIPYYKARYNNCDFSYTNYNCLNFYYDPDRHTGNEMLVYQGPHNYITPANQDSDQFFISFWINPRYKQITPHAEFGAGTVLHISSSVSISLITGSSKDVEGCTDKFRIALQLSHSADTNPSSLVFDSTNQPVSSNFPDDLTIITDDNTLSRNTWHYVSAKWSESDGKNVTLRVDDKKLTYSIPSSSIARKSDTNYRSNYLFLGNYYDGAPSEVTKFFSENNAALDFALKDDSASKNARPNFNSGDKNPLQAEIHEVRIHSKYLSDTIEEAYRYTSFPHRPRLSSDTLYTNHSKGESRLNFYLPVWYDSVINSRLRINTNDGYLLYNPALYHGTNLSKISRRSTLVTPPTNPLLSNGIGGKYVNVYNFTRNVGKGREQSFEVSNEKYTQPIHFNMSASLVSHLDFDASDDTVAFQSTRDYFYNQASVRRRNTLVVPCDNGSFIPDYYFSAKSEANIKFTTYRNANQLGNESYETINLSHILSGNAENVGDTIDRKVNELENFPIAYITQDRSSNDISVFSISSLYYGERIHPGSLTIKDPNLTGSYGKLSYTLKDDGRGSLYRADSNGEHATWASVGNVFYDEGIILVKTPHLPYFGKEGYRLDFKGEQSTHVTTLHVPCPEEMFISSSNPTYQFLTASNLSSDEDNPFVYITGVNIHDNNLNVIMKANLAQPVKKRKTDSYLFRLKQDY